MESNTQNKHEEKETSTSTPIEGTAVPVQEEERPKIPKNVPKGKFFLKYMVPSALCGCIPIA